MSASWDRSDADDLFVRVLPDEGSRTSTEPADRGWRVAVRGEYPDGNVWVEEERVFPERVDNPKAQRILETAKGVTLRDDEQLWLVRTLLEFGGERRIRQLIDTLDHETAERWSVICAERALRAAS